ncbi:MAG: HEAT repeat domain-containing protein, partial [Verrucomicrobiota bacterium]
RRHMDQLTWYYDLARHPDGGFRMFPFPEERYLEASWGIGVALAYTAPLKTLRITGGAPTMHSVIKPVPPVDWGNARDLEFISNTPAPGFGPEDEDPHETAENLGVNAAGQPASYFGKLLRHYDPVIRDVAAAVLGLRADAASMAEVEAALQDPDVRVRRAALDAVSGYDSFFYNDETAIPSLTVSTQLMPHIQAILDDPDAAWWEIDGALFALGQAQPHDIRTNMALICEYIDHEEWYLRESAFFALVGLHTNITTDEFIKLTDMYAIESRVFVRNSMYKGFDVLLNVDGLNLSLPEEDIQRLVLSLGRSIIDPPIEEGYEHWRAVNEAVHRTMMVFEEFERDDIIGYVVDEVVQFFDGYTTNWHESPHYPWLLTGSPWQQGMGGYALGNGPDGAWLVHLMKQNLDRVNQAILDGVPYQGLTASQSSLISAIQAWETL